MKGNALEDLIKELRREYDAAPWWKRTWWRLRGWVWPFRWDSHFGAIEMCFPVQYVAGSMPGTQRLTWLWSRRSKPFRFPVGFRIQFGTLWTWERVWSKED